MTKFKPFYEFQKPLIHLAPESYLDYIGGVIPQDHLCRMVKEVVFSLDTESIRADDRANRVKHRKESRRSDGR